MRRDDRAAYERAFGIKPPGYRGTGPVDWFQLPWPERAPCRTCGVETGRWHIVTVRNVLKRSRFDYEEFFAECWKCERPKVIAALERRQQNAVIDEGIRAAEAIYLAELREEERSEVNHHGAAVGIGVSAGRGVEGAEGERTRA